MSKPINSPYIAWIDTETTGNDRQNDAIIEFGMVVTDRDLNELWHYTAVVCPDRSFNIGEMSPVVVRMHKDNHLLFEVNGGRPITEVDEEVSTYLRELNGGNHIPLAGSGVSHFDRRFIEREMPKTDKLLSYWHLDIGAVRRWLTIWDLEVPEAAAHQAKTHRALDDVREHISEARAIRDRFRKDREIAYQHWRELVA